MLIILTTMQAASFNMSGYPLCEYLLVLSPHEDLQDKILKIKDEFYKSYNVTSSFGFGSNPHIPLMKFNTWERMEEKIVNFLKVIAMGTLVFKVALKDYGSLPSHTIYINVTTRIPINNLIVRLREAKKLMKSPNPTPHFITDFYIPVARNLLPWQYEKGWLEYSHRHFTASFMADGMLLLKRKEGEKAYQIVQHMKFMNLSVGTKQGILF